MAVTINGTTGIVTPDIEVDGSTLVIDSANNRVGVLEDSPSNTLTVGDTVQPSYAPASAGNYIEIARTSGADAGLLINKNTGQWLIGIDNSDGANSPLKFEFGAAGSAHPGFGAGTLGMIIKHDGNIGIGTADPGALLHLESTAANAARLRIGFDSPRYYDIFRGSTTNSGYLNFYGSQSSFTGYIFDGVDGERLRIDTAGRIGIGGNGVGSGLGVYLQRPAPNTTHFYEASDGTKKMITGVDSTNDYVKIGSLSNHRLGLVANNGEKLSILPSGNIGINRTDPDQKLNINGNLEVNAYDSPSGSGGYYTLTGLIIGNAYDAGKTTTDDRNAIIWQERGLDLDIATSDTLRMKITYDGKVGVKNSNPDELLEVGDGTVSGALKVSGQSSSVTSDGFTVDWESSSNSTRFFSEPSSGGSSAIRFFTTSSGTRAERLRIQSTGGISFNGDTAAANALDDYEEGTWTVSDAEGSNPVTSNVSWYVKVGSLVHIRASVNIGTTSSTSRISLTLPFNSNNAAYYAGEGCVGFTTYTGATPRPVIENGGTRLYFYNENSIDLMTWQNFSGKRIDFSVTYQRT